MIFGLLLRSICALSDVRLVARPLVRPRIRPPVRPSVRPLLHLSVRPHVVHAHDTRTHRCIHRLRTSANNRTRIHVRRFRRLPMCEKQVMITVFVYVVLFYGIKYV